MAETRIYMDLSMLCLTPFTTGIQRVAKEIVLRMLKNPDISLTLLAATPSQTAWRVLPHSAFTEYYTEKTGSPYGEGLPQIITPADIPTDAVFFDIDSAWNMPMHRSWLFPRLKMRGVTIVSHLYDLIPVTEPQYFHTTTMRQFLSWTTAVLQYADHIICNADATKAALHTLCTQLEHREPPCTVVPLGADFAKKTVDPESVDTKLLNLLTPYRYLLMVGTVEPRKNHQLLYDAVNQLSERGIKVVFAGRLGWNMDHFAKAISKHPKNGKDFFFVQGPTDATIQALYKDALAVVFPTRNEGFGLPIVEAFLNGTPVLASDIPVLREVGGDMADYFDNTSVDSLLQAVDALLADEEAYQKKRAAIAAYRPRTWDTAADEMVQALRRTCRIQGSVPEHCRVSQMVVLTARNQDLLRTLPYLDACMPFIERMLVCCPKENIAELQAKWNGRIRLEFCSDEQLLNGETLPADHTERNFFLRCLMMRNAPLDDVFLMTDDDYRPLREITQKDFIRNGRYQAYYCYDLCEWHGTQEQYTSYDRSMFRTRDFLAAQHLPALQYSSHQPQIIDRRLYLEMLDAFPGIEHRGLDEWSTYFNYCISKHTAQFAAVPYAAVGWPGNTSDWALWCQPKELFFENYYEALYEEDGIFAGLSGTYDPARFADESAEKIRRWSEALTKQRVQLAQMRMYREMYRDSHSRPPEFLLTEQDGVPELHIPDVLYLPAGGTIHMPLLTDETMRSTTEPIEYCIANQKGDPIVPGQTLRLDTVDAGVAPELVFLMPPTPFTGILTVTCGECTAECVVRCLA